MTERQATEPRAGRRLRGEAGFGLVGYAVIAGIIALLLAGAAVLVSTWMSSDSASEPAPSASPTSVTGMCAGDTWFDPDTATCLPKAVCAEGQEYVQLTNTCEFPPPVVTAIEPDSGLTTGGTEIRIAGSGFRPGATVTIDGTPAGSVTVVSDTTITAATPSSTNTFPVDVEVANPGSDPGLLNNAFTYVPPAVEVVTSVSPGRGSKAGGEAVIIKGTGFAGGVRVAFGGRSATDVVVLNPSTLRVVTPAGAVGRVAVNVRVPGQDLFSLEDAFRYVNQPPRVITSVRPKQGPLAGGTRITITGSGFGSGATVTVGGTRASKVTIASSTRITAVTPKGILGAADVAVRNPDLPAAILADAFTYIAAPTITALGPARGPVTGGTKVTIQGTGFLSGATVAFGKAKGTGVKVISPTRLTVVTPKGQPGAVDLTVTNPDQPAAVAKKVFTYVAVPDEPTGGGTGGGTGGELPRCKPVSMPRATTTAGSGLVLTDLDLFPDTGASVNYVIDSAAFAGNTGDGVDGTITVKGSPPRIVWQAPSVPGTGGLITYSYRASNCEGSANGTIRVSAT